MVDVFPELFSRLPFPSVGGLSCETFQPEPESSKTTVPDGARTQSQDQAVEEEASHAHPGFEVDEEEEDIFAMLEQTLSALDRFSEMQKNIREDIEQLDHILWLAADVILEQYGEDDGEDDD